MRGQFALEFNPKTGRFKLLFERVHFHLFNGHVTVMLGGSSRWDGEVIQEKKECHSCVCFGAIVPMSEHPDIIGVCIRSYDDINRLYALPIKALVHQKHPRSCIKPSGRQKLCTFKGDCESERIVKGRTLCASPSTCNQKIDKPFYTLCED